MSGDRKKLIEDLKNFSIRKGEEFTLVSGQESNIYVDVKQTMLYGPTMHNLANLLHKTNDEWIVIPRSKFSREQNWMLS